MNKPESETEQKYIADLARDFAELAMVFYNPTPEAYKLRAKNSYQRGFIDGVDYERQKLKK